MEYYTVLIDKVWRDQSIVLRTLIVNTVYGTVILQLVLLGLLSPILVRLLTSAVWCCASVARAAV